MSRSKTFIVIAILSILFSSCQAIGDIFSAGMWFGIIAVVVVIIILFAVFRKRG